ncbi:RagB/SusD family nutrient uptake outer membrane protein [Membranihabitans maritimus]|uniref:RagB/SusD family nutrient uptake outer membrane protein n=1 Tax=Membranihabitans maritimus TaxID=2904244 RepID=UPI001F268476|nr:RagB/SusD family nutrient uptake outer membrane protein [Membranihabitans maritimus]
MKHIVYRHPFFALLFFILGCNDEFLQRSPLDTPSLDTFWENEEQAELWVNNLYIGLGGVEESIFEAFSDNAYGRAGSGANSIANGLYDTNDPHVSSYWDYRDIRLSLEFFEYIKDVPNISQAKLDELSGQVHFMLAYQYYRMVTLYGDIPLVTSPLGIEESDISKSSKEEVLRYIFDQLNLAIEKLPLEWPESETGRITKGAALALKARLHLYNNEWNEAASTAKEIIDLDQYSLHPNFEEVFLSAFNNQTSEVILAYQYAENVNTHPGQGIVRRYAPVNLGGYALILPTDELQQSFEMADGSPFDWNNPEHAANPFNNRDPRFYHTFIYQGLDYNGATVDFTGSEARFAFTYLYYLKYVADLENNFWDSYVNWIIFRYADVLLMYAEAKNEVSGPDQSIYDALNQIRRRSGMPDVDQMKYNDQASLRDFIRNERRVELAAEGLRYFDILRWGIAEDVLNRNIKSLDLSNWVDLPKDEEGNSLLPYKDVQTRIFNPEKNYVWPIPQDAIDRAENLEQHPAW